MKTMMVRYAFGLGGVYDGKQTVRTFELVTDPIPLEQARAHLNLGGAVVAMRDGVFCAHVSSEWWLASVELWPGVQWHVLVREI